MKATEIRVFDNRCIYSHRKCIRLDLNLGDYVGLSSKELNSFSDELVKLLPDIAKHKCSLDEENGFLKILTEEVCLNHICGHIAIALQNMIGLDVSFCSQSKEESKDYYTIYEYEHKNTGIEAGYIAIEIINSLIDNKELNLNSKLNRLKEVLKKDRIESGKINSSEMTPKRDIPIIAITGTNGKTTTTRLIAYVVSKAGLKVGMTTTDGIYINGQCIYEGDTTGPRSAMTVLTNNDVEVAVLETARGGIVRSGLAYDLADVAVITNITDDHLGLDGIETLEDLAKAKSLVGEAVKTDGYVVINGNDDMSLSILNRIKSKIIVFSEHRNNEALLESIKNGGYGIYILNENLCIENKDGILPLMKVRDIGITVKGALKYNIQNAMAAFGALIGFGIDPSIIREGLQAFQCNEELNPGRFNSFDVNGALVILDYGHNVDGYKSVLEGISNIEHNKLIGIIGVPGDRLDRATFDVGRISGQYFDQIFIKEDKDRRGRAAGEIADLLRKGVLDSGFCSMDLKIILDEKDALEEALDSASPGDIIIVFFEEYAPLLKLLKERINDVETEDSLIAMG